MLHIFKEPSRNVCIFCQSEATAEQTKDALDNPYDLVHLMTIDDADGTLYAEVKTKFYKWNIHYDWYTVENCFEWQSMFNRLIAFSSYENREAIYSMFGI